MDLYRVETVTIIAIIVIAIILTIYLAILKRNGLLDRSNQFYRCPNPECKKIFHNPVDVKDLSETPRQAYPACPECGTDLRQYFGQEPSPNITTPAECTYYLGYLSNLDKQKAIPKKCSKCSSYLKCLLFDNKPKDPLSDRFY